MKITSADNVNDLRQKNRTERIALWLVAAGRGGLVSPGNAAWLLDLSHTRIKALTAAGKLTVRKIAGVGMILFSSVQKFDAAQKRRLQQQQKKLARASLDSKMKNRS